ncbi:helix-turn-helix domain-containing protein [Bradyrhizobium sp. AUGA SZCCT0124]|uniref:helix-turn-helix domain-containing protein n=1 Tax=Bradyrhizobium sp. AUGA SZCCT0124 TaxID=2807658 RepID=UPI002011BF9D|nr:helix-turn-helix domain-containing protein [Bradyrhizobium sp. AUGA SZCCT0124]
MSAVARKAKAEVIPIISRLCLSERTLNRRFRELTHEPPQAFITRRRVEHARTLLETTAQPIKAIARATGYKDESSFRKAFRKLTLLSPQAHRAQRAMRAA